MGKFLLGLLWLAASVYAGYRLTEHSFRFLKEPGFGLGEAAPLTQILEFDPGALKEKLPTEGENPESWYASQPPETQACLRTAVGEENFQAALSGKEIRPTPPQMLAVAACLK